MRVLTFGFNLPSLARGWHGLEAGQAGNPDARDPSLTALNCHRRLGRLHHLHHHHCHYHRCHGGPLPSVHRRPPPPSPPPWQPLRTRPWTDDDGRRDGWRGKRATRPRTSKRAPPCPMPIFGSCRYVDTIRIVALARVVPDAMRRHRHHRRLAAGPVIILRASYRLRSTYIIQSTETLGVWGHGPCLGSLRAHAGQRASRATRPSADDLSLVCATNVGLDTGDGPVFTSM